MPIRLNGFLAYASKPPKASQRPLTISSFHWRLALPRTSLPPLTRHASSEAYRQHIAVIGGGITGLTTAYCLSKRDDIKVTIYEEQERLGGWIQSKHFDAPGGRVLFEQGPRTLRPGLPNGILTAGLAEELGLANDLVFTPKRSAAALSRYIYYPDHLVQLPYPGMGGWNMLWTILREPVFKGLTLRALMDDLMRPAYEEPLRNDVSVGTFVANHLGPDLVNDLVSPVMHGIYAGDVWKLSANMLMPQLRIAAAKQGSLILALMGYGGSYYKLEDAELISKWSKTRPPISEELERKLNVSSTFTFRGGLGQLTARLGEVLRERDNVELRFGELATIVKPENADQKVEVRSAMLGEPRDMLQADTMKGDAEEVEKASSNQPSDHYDQVISANCSGMIEGLAPLRTSMSSFRIDAVSVGVVNLYYTNPNLLSVTGFGYLIPQNIPFEQNPELALGVVFDSDTVQGQDTAPGTKLTVMLGGHWWKQFYRMPSSSECFEMAKSVVRRHLNVTEEPTLYNSTVNHSCIPQYPVNYRRDRLRHDHEHLLSIFHGRVKVAGSWFNGVGVNDCVRGATDVAESALSPDWRDKTGLEIISRTPEFAQLEPSRRRT